MYPLLYKQPNNCQCGGINFVGPTQCDTGLSCYVKDQKFSQCLATCPIGWPCQSKIISLQIIHSNNLI